MKICATAGVTISIALLAFPAASEVMGQGVGITDSCGSVVQAFKRHAPGTEWVYRGELYPTESTNYMTWVQGYITAENFHRDEPNQIRVDRAGVAGWIENYCRKHPTQLLLHATMEFIRTTPTPKTAR